jgi:glycosyltransferase involved in cell wall biosynthesis
MDAAMSEEETVVQVPEILGTGYSPSGMAILEDKSARSDPRDSSRSRAHIVMMVANDVRADTRVRKMAESLASTGVSVTVIGLDHLEDGFEDTIGLADLVVLRTRRRFGTKRFRMLKGRSDPYWKISEVAHARDMFQIQRREAASKIEWIREDGMDQRLSIGDRASARKQKAVDRYSSTRVAVKKKSRGGNRFIRLGSRAALDLIDLGYRGIRSTHRAQTALDIKMAQFVPQTRERLVRKQLAISRSRSDSRIGRLKRRLTKERTRGDTRWRVFSRAGNWRRDLPELTDYEAVIGPLLDELDADVFHAHDVHLLGVATRAAARARYRGSDTRVIYDAHEYVAGLARYSKRTVEAYVSIEQEYIRRVDRVITVSEPLADLIESDFGLDQRPDVVLNIPVTASPDVDVPSLYAAAGVPLDAETMVYSGGIDEARNVHTIVKALPLLPENLHLVLVARRETNYTLSLFDLAEDLDVRNRIHLAPFVGPNDVVAYLSEASVGIHAMISSKMNHQIALPNKIFEYLHAGLPMCVSDNQAMMDFVTENGVGEWFIAEDPESLAGAVTRVLADRTRYVGARYEDPDLLEFFSWDRQAEHMVDVYRDLLGEPELERGQFSVGDSHVVEGDERPKARLAIASINQAGQASLWAYGLIQNIPDVSTSVFMLVRPEKLQFPASDPVEIPDWWDPRWQRRHRRRIARDFTHVLIESGSLVLGGRRGAHFDSDLDALRVAGVEPALVFHGSDIRNPAVHRDLVADSPFHLRDDFTMGLEASTAKMLELVGGFDGPIFVSTKDLLDYVPGATWLPQVVEVERWAAPPAPIGERILVVASTFTSRRLKGADEVDAVCNALMSQGRIDYRSHTGIPPEKMPAIIADVDVLIDGISLGLYGTTSVEGMAAGRLVLGNIDRVIDKPGEAPPIVNVNPTNLRETLEDIADRPDHYREIAQRGPGFVRRYHDGRYSAEQLAGFLGVDVPPSLWAEDQLRVSSVSS